MAKETIILTGSSQQGSNWYYGIVGGYRYKALRFDEPSQFGINEGKVSKLLIANKKMKVVVLYERGWSKKPSKTFQPIYERLLNFLENAKVVKTRLIA